jgi:hypothetical protein
MEYFENRYQQQTAPKPQTVTAPKEQPKPTVVAQSSTKSKEMSKGTKVAIGIGAAVVACGLIYYFYNSSNKTATPAMTMYYF